MDSIKNKENEFEKLKSDYLQTEELQEKIIEDMRQNLRERGALETQVCLDEKEHALASENVDDLFCIHGWLKFAKNKKG